VRLSRHGATVMPTSRGSADVGSSHAASENKCPLTIVPFDRNVVTPAMMPPSRDTSHKVFTPVVSPTPVRIVSDLLVDAVQGNVNAKDHTSSTLIVSPARPIQIAIPQLTSSDAGFLTSNSPIKSSSQPPDLPTMEISPIKCQL
jgi:hypothetical protein